jgi:hypothetical protein
MREKYPYTDGRFLTDPTPDCGHSGHPYQCGCHHEHPIGCKCGCGRTTYCDRDRKNNVWLEGADAEGRGGSCLLDSMRDDQVIYCIQRDEKARQDLLRVTSDEHLLKLAHEVPALPSVEDGDKLQKESNADQSPFYAIFRGQPPFAQ